MSLNRFLYTFMIVSICSQVYCQGVGGLNQSSDPSIFETWVRTNSIRDFNENEGIIGEIFLFEEWADGTVSLVSGNSFDKLKVKYNEYLDELIVKKQGMASPIVLDKKTVESFSVTDPKTLETYSFQLKNLGRDDLKFLQILYNGKACLYQLRSVKLLEADNNSQAYGSGQQFDKYVKDYKYLIQSEGMDELKSIKLRKSDVLSALKDNGELEKYIKRNKLKLKHLDDVITLLEHNESL